MPSKAYFGYDQSATTLLSSVLVENSGFVSASDSVIFEFSVDFGRTGNAVKFFESGGEILLTTTRSGGTTGGTTGIHNASWDALLANVGTVKMLANETVNPNAFGTANPIGYYGLTPTYQTIYTANASGAYSDNEYRIEAQTLPTASGSIVNFRVNILDFHPDFFIPPPPVFQYSPYNDPLPSEDTFDGNFETVVDIIKNEDLKQKTPNVETTSAWNAV